MSYITVAACNIVVVRIIDINIESSVGNKITVNDLIYNLPDTYDIDTDLLALYAENAPVGYETPFMHAACNNTGDVFIADGEDNTIAFVAIDNDGNSEILLTYDYSPLL